MNSQTQLWKYEYKSKKKNTIQKIKEKKINVRAMFLFEN